MKQCITEIVIKLKVIINLIAPILKIHILKPEVNLNFNVFLMDISTIKP